jgi:phosphomannomutase
MNNDKKVAGRYTRYDIRGIVGDDLDSATVTTIAHACGDYLTNKTLL